MQPGPTDRDTRAAYDQVASDYARMLPDMSMEAPLDRAVLAAFAEMVGECRDAPVADVGCGTGRVTKHLHDAGIPVLGFDLSARMAAVARASHAGLSFAAAHAAALPLRAGALGGLVAWYSLINMPTEGLPHVLAEFARVTSPGAPVLLAFQSGDGQRVDTPTSYGHPVPLTYYRHDAEEVATAMTAAGFDLYATVDRGRALWFESTPQTALLAHRSRPA